MNKVADKERVHRIEVHTPATRSRQTAHRSGTIAFSLLAILIAACAPCAVAAQSLPLKTAPEFVLTDLDNKTIDLNAYRGKVVLLNFWATWCAPCQNEMPRFVAWQNEYGPRGFEVIGISMDDDPAAVRAFLKKLQVNYPVAMGDEKLGELYGGVLGLPLTLLIDGSGTIRARYEGATRLTVIESELTTLLRHP